MRARLQCTAGFGVGILEWASGCPPTLPTSASRSPDHVCNPVCAPPVPRLAPPLVLGPKHGLIQASDTCQWGVDLYPTTRSCHGDRRMVRAITFPRDSALQQGGEGSQLHAAVSGFLQQLATQGCTPLPVPYCRHSNPNTWSSLLHLPCSISRLYPDANPVQLL